MNKKNIIGLVLIFAIFVGYMWWVSPSEEERAEMLAKRQEQIDRYNDSIAQVEAAKAEKARQDSLTAAGDTTALEVRMMEKRSRLGAFGACAEGDTAAIMLKNEKMTVAIDPMGGAIKQVVINGYTTYEGHELELITPSNDNMNLVFSTEDNRVINTKDLTFAPYIDNKPLQNCSELEVAEGDSLVLSMRAYTADAEGSKGGYLEFRYTMRDNYDLGYTIAFHGLKNVVRKESYWDFEWNNKMNRQEKVDQSSKGSRNRNKDAERFNSNIYYKPLKDKVDNLRMGTDSEKQIKSGVNWVAFKQQFFAAILINDNGFANADMAIATNHEDTAANYLCNMGATLGITYDGNADCATDMHFYFGPTKYRDLRAMHQGFERMLPLGWGFFLTQWVSRYVIIPVFNFLEKFNWNYGIIIIILTVLLKIVLFPLVFKSYQGSAIMRILRPEMDALNKKYPNQEQAMQKNQEMMKLQRKAGYSPMAGCLPMLLQMPILFAMFRFFPASIELRQKGFLWCDDLSTYDSILDFGFNVPLYGDHISLFCLLMFGVQFFYTWYTMKSQPANASMPGMKFMMYFMPFMMLFMFNSQSAALNIYYFLSLSITMIQMILIRKFTSEKKVRARMAAYDLQQSKPGKKGSSAKKSKFQQRLEELQRQAEEMQKQQQRRN